MLTASRHARRLAPVDFPTPVEPITRMRIPKSFSARNAQSRRDLASALRSRTEGAYRPRDTGYRDDAASRTDPRVAELRAAMKAHPCHQCPDRESHARWAERYLKLERDTQNQRRRIEQRTNTVARQFDRVCEVLDELGYLDGDTVTADGRRLQRLYSELDLLVSECLRRGVWDDLDASQLAAVLSGLTFESRVDDPPAPRFPDRATLDVAEEMARTCAELQALEREHRLKFLATPDFGFAATVSAWVAGASLDDVLRASDMAAGDFVRAMKQLIDLVAQVAMASGDSPLRRTAHEALDGLRRGVVAYSSLGG